MCEGGEVYDGCALGSWRCPLGSLSQIRPLGTPQPARNPGPSPEASCIMLDGNNETHTAVAWKTMSRWNDVTVQVRELNDENEVELEFFTDAYVTFKSAFFARRDRYPPAGMLVHELNALNGKVSTMLCSLAPVL